MQITQNPSRYLFFTGKGGVGKTSLACATAIALADAGKRILLLSTDPASNLDEVLEVALSFSPTKIPGIEKLWALNIDPEVAAKNYLEKMVGPYRGVLPAATIRNMEEQLSGSCTMEIAAFDEFAKFLGNPQQTENYDHVIFDTAPTGHTLRLLSLPTAWTSFLETSTTGTSCLGPLSGLKEQQKLYAETLQALSDKTKTTLVLVSRPETSALREAARSSNELRELGIAKQFLLLNGVFTAKNSGDFIASAYEKRCKLAMTKMENVLTELPRQEVKLNSRQLIGIQALRSVLSNQDQNEEISVSSSSHIINNPSSSILEIINELAKSGHGVIMTMGKGGVGKTTLAATIAWELAKRGHPVHLTTTDPAAHVSWIIEKPPANLKTSCINAETEVAAYRKEVMESVGVQLDEQGRALLAEDLRSPCTEEVAIFRSFARIVSEGKTGFVVCDTAPTGHTILLLDAAEAYHREVLRQSSNMPDTVKELLPLLRNPDFTKIILVALPEATPVHEAARLQNDLARAEIKPFAWIINQAFSPLITTDPVLLSRKSVEHRYINEVNEKYSTKVALVPWFSEPPIGNAGLTQILEVATS